MNFNKIIIDSSSIINFFKYYHNYFCDYIYEFKKKEYKIIFDGLIDFLIQKIKNGEIVVLDKVYDELKIKDYDFFKKSIKEYIIDTLEFHENVCNMVEKYRIPENEKFYNHNQDKINLELEKFENEYADIFLIVYLLSLNKNKVLLITEETFRKDNKLLPKIPEICKNEKIYFRNLPYLLFEFYKNELNFNLFINI